MKRRKFVFGCLGAAAVGLSSWSLRSQSRWASSASRLKGMAKISRSGQALGTEVLITVFHDDPQQGEFAIQQAFAAIDQVEQLMSLYRLDGQLVRLNREGFLDLPHPELVRVLNYATQLSEQSGGAFDVTVQPLWACFNEAALNKRLPAKAAVAAARRQVDWRQVSILPEAVSFGRSGMAITLNGIAQGFAADAACSALRSHGIEHALIDSGEIGTVGSRIDQKEWSIGIKHPRNQENLLGVAGLDGRCLATVSYTHLTLPTKRIV